MQIIADEKTKDILSIAFSKGKTHDFKLFKDSLSGIREDILIIADKGYKGIFEIHFNSLIPIKATRNHKLTSEEKAFNSALSKR